MLMQPGLVTGISVFRPRYAPRRIISLSDFSLIKYLPSRVAPHGEIFALVNVVAETKRHHADALRQPGSDISRKSWRKLFK